LVRLDVARDAQGFEVVATKIVCQPLHLLLSLGRLHRLLVMHVNRTCDVTVWQYTSRYALTSTPFAQWMFAKVVGAYRLPPLRVQQLLVSWVSAHSLEVWVFAFVFLCNFFTVPLESSAHLTKSSSVLVYNIIWMSVRHALSILWVVALDGILI
jgi:hypothetical protein